MEIVFSNHCEIKIRQRKINKSFVIKTLLSPDFIKPSYGGRFVSYKNFGSNFLAVVAKKEDDKLFAITTHWIAKIKKK